MKFILITTLLLVVVATATTISSQTIVPSKVTECFATSSTKDFCETLNKNTTWAIHQEYAPGIASAVASFGHKWGGSKKDILKNKNNNKYKNKKFFGKLNSQDNKIDLKFPGWSSANDYAVISTGRYTYEDWTSKIDDSISLFDMASCSKIMATTTAIAQLYQMGVLDLDEKVASEKLLGKAFASKGKGNITVRNLLLHNAGYPPDPTPNWYSSPKFPCKNSGGLNNNQRYHPVMDFDCLNTIYNDLVYNQTLVYPTGSKFIYSDLSMITLMFVISKVVTANNLVPDMSQWPAVCQGRKDVLSCSFYAYVHINIFKRYGLDSTQYIPTDTMRTPPQWQDDDWHHRLIMGFVSDQNTYAMGGISGHAGVYSTGRDALTFLSIWMDEQDPAMLNSTTIELFTTVGNITQSSRALGWDTNDQPDPPCGKMSKKSFLHEGFTGTFICGDPVSGIVLALLGNGRYPHYHHDGMITYRPIFSSLVHDLLGKQ